MKPIPQVLVHGLGLCLLFVCSLHGETQLPHSPYSKWTHGPSTNDHDFPIAVWLQSPSNADRFKKLGINTYVGLWKGPTSEQLQTLERAEMKLICDQNAVARKHMDSSTIIGWMHGDEPDNAQSLPSGKGYGPPILPSIIQSDYQRLAAADPTRPILLNLGQGVAWDHYIGRGVRRDHPEDYPEYVKGCDIASFDIYPVVHESPEIVGKLEFVGHGVKRLCSWAGKNRIVWNCIECTHIENPAQKATPDQIRTEVWMALIHGSRGLIYFVHEFKPKFKEAALLEDRDQADAVGRINHEILDLAPWLNGPTLSDAVEVQANPKSAQSIAWIVKHRASDPKDTFDVYAVNESQTPTSVTFAIGREIAASGLNGNVQVLQESRNLELREGRWTDAFRSYDVHRYRITQR